MPPEEMLKTNVGILIFDDVDALDFAGPLEVFARTRLVPGIESRRSEQSAPFNVLTIGKHRESCRTSGGLELTPRHGFADAPRIDLLVVPGGYGTRPLIHDSETIGWIKDKAREATKTCSVCTGALLLAKAGLLSGRKATTHWGAVELLSSLDCTVRVDTERRVVDDGIITSAGVAAGLDMAFYIVELLYGRAVADETARYIEYRREPLTYRSPLK